MRVFCCRPLSTVGTCESFFSFESNLRIESSNRIGRIFNPSVIVFVTNESDVRTTELQTEYLFLSFSHKTRQTMLLYAYFTPKVDFKRKFSHHQSFLYE